MSPHETLFLESTGNVNPQWVTHNEFLKFQIWDFGGDVSFQADISFGGKSINIGTFLKNCSTLIYVIDAQEEDYEDSLPKLVELISFAHNLNPKIHFEVFLHKVDGDFMSEETKAERQQVCWG